MGPGGFTKMYEEQVFVSETFISVVFFFADLGLINGLVHPLNFQHLSWEDARRGRSSRRRVGLSRNPGNAEGGVLPVANLVLVHRNVRDECSTCHRCCRSIVRLRQGVPGGKKWRNSSTGWKVLSCAVDDCLSFLQPEPFSSRSWKTWALVGLKASFFCLPQAGAQLQVFDMFDGDADGRKCNKSSNSNVSFQIGLTGGKQSPYWCFSLTRAA